MILSKSVSKKRKKEKEKKKREGLLEFVQPLPISMLPLEVRRQLCGLSNTNKDTQ